MDAEAENLDLTPSLDSLVSLMNVITGMTRENSTGKQFHGGYRRCRSESTILYRAMGLRERELKKEGRKQRAGKS